MIQMIKKNSKIQIQAWVNVELLSCKKMQEFGR
jgi:hypothetical protein